MIGLAFLAATQVATSADIDYYTGEGRDPEKHKLDVFAPEEVHEAPVLIFVHGGAWRMGDRRLYGRLGESFAARGFVTVIPSYRLSPAVTYPAYAEDVARAVAWVHREIAGYGGDPERLFLMGHSAGGHLVALVATNTRFFEAEGVPPSAIRGVIPMSGVYNIAPIVARMNDGVFPEDEEGRRDASPVAFVRDGLPPFLVIWGDRDMPGAAEGSRRFVEALEEASVPARTLEVEDRTHITLILRTPREGDPAGDAIAAFVREHAEE